MVRPSLSAKWLILGLLSFLSLCCQQSDSKDQMAAEEKPLPQVEEPNWLAWGEARPAMIEVWKLLASVRPDRTYESEDEKDRSLEMIRQSLPKLEEDPDAACAAGASLMRDTDDDYTRMMIGAYLEFLADPEKAEPFYVWGLSQAEDIDSVFSPVYHKTRELAARKDPQFLPSVFSILRAREARLFLEDHMWYVETHECMYYVLASYGREAIPYLYPMLSHEDPYVRRNAAFALGLFFDDHAKERLASLLEYDDIGSGGAAFALGELDAQEYVVPIAQLLSNNDTRTRFLAAYALYELGSAEAIPFLEKAHASETDDLVAREIEVALQNSKDPEPLLGEGASKLSSSELHELLDELDAENGLQLSTNISASVAASAGPEHLEQLEAIRYGATLVPSDMGNKAFRLWTRVLKSVRRRVVPR